MSPLPKLTGIVATIVAVIGAVSALVRDPVVHAFVAPLITKYPEIAVLVSAVTVIVAALSHSLTGDGGKPSA